MQLVPERLHPSRTALLIVDVQNDYCHPEGALGSKGADLQMVEGMHRSITGLLDAAYGSGVPVIFVQTRQDSSTDSEAWLARSNGKPRGVCVADSWGAELYRLQPKEEDTIVYKHRYSAFIHTRLDAVLRAKRITTLVVAGISTNVCVESTARDGFMLDYHIVLPQDACAAFSRAAHDMTLYNIDGWFGAVTDSGTVAAIWNEAAGRTAR